VNILLPATHRRAMLRSFWLIICFLTGLVTAIVAWSLGWPWPVGIALSVGALLASLVLIQENVVWFFYRAWNVFVKMFAAIARQIATWVCYFIVFGVVGRAGSHFPLIASRASGSFWIKRDLLAHNALRESPAANIGTPRRLGWIRDYFRWTIHSGNVWAITLLPFLVILQTCSKPQAETKEFNIYTLF
jgi:hypothetical protein